MNCHTQSLSSRTCRSDNTCITLWNDQWSIISNLITHGRSIISDSSSYTMYLFIYNPWFYKLKCCTDTYKSIDYIHCRPSSCDVCYLLLFILQYPTFICSFPWFSSIFSHTQYHLFNSFSVGIDFRRQNLTSIDVRFWHLKSVPALKGLNIPELVLIKCSFQNGLWLWPSVTSWYWKTKKDVHHFHGSWWRITPIWVDGEIYILSL